MDGPPAGPADGGQEPWDEERVGRILDRGEFVEIPIVEEVLVKKPVVREVLRIRKDVLSETHLVEGRVRIEDLRRLAAEGQGAPAVAPPYSQGPGHWLRGGPPEPPAPRFARRARGSFLAKGLAAVAGAMDGYAEQSRRARLPEAAAAAVGRTLEALEQGAAGFRGEPPPPATQARSVAHRVGDAFYRAEGAAAGVAESADRARAAPPRVARRARRVGEVVAADLRRTFTGYLGAALLAAFAVSFLLVALARSLDLLFGAPWGTALVTTLLTLAAFGAYLWAAARGVDVRWAARAGWRRVQARTAEEARATGAAFRAALRGRHGARAESP